MSNRGSITLGEVKGKLTMLEVACHRCDRKGRVNVQRLIDTNRHLIRSVEVSAALLAMRAPYRPPRRS